MLDKLKFSMSLQIFVALILGLVVGSFAGEFCAPLGEVGKLLIQLIKTLAVPLVFFAILEAFVQSTLTWKDARHLLKIVSINAICAAIIGLGLANFFQSGKHLHIDGLKTDSATNFMTSKLEPIKIISAYIPNHIFQPFVENNILLIVIYALFLGAAFKTLKKETSVISETFEHGVGLCYKLTEKILSWVLKVVPFAVFAVVAKTLGQYGWAPFKGLLWYVGIGLLGLFLQPILVYAFWIKGFCRIPLKKFWHEVRPAVVYGIGSNSSLATLPVTLNALDRLKVSKASSRLGACIGTNLNNDGIFLYEAMALLFVAQYYGIQLDIGQQLIALGFCMIAAIGIAGVPEAGIVSLSLVLSTVGLPLELLPFLLSVDWILARARTVVNVLSDITVSCSIDEFKRRSA